MQFRALIVAAASASLVSATINANSLQLRQSDELEVSAQALDVSAANAPEVVQAAADLPTATPNMNIISDLPSIPISVAMQLATAVPSSVITNPEAYCSALNGQRPSWFTSLPGDVQSVISSYGSAMQSWQSKHASELASFTATAAITGLCGSGTHSGGKAGATAEAASATGNNAPAARPTALAAGIVGAVGILGLAIGL